VAGCLYFFFVLVLVLLHKDTSTSEPPVQ
jgi:hypothetical protein